MSEKSKPDTPNSWDFDAEGLEQGDPCPQCGSSDTVTYHYTEGFTELECRRCGFTSEGAEIGELARYRGELQERDTHSAPPIPIKKLEA